ncbi:Prepilin peptidase [Sulfidibacter corallicola]|uniref:Prepilin peptidase n=1 Tax=Sulfidibacter corallicola TaxID=2818388 RepID=A0A8A4TSW9_SULCO|nr:A24 family peptidase [Sulfidibacter corallicola]QTD52142.1 prepilin peptidase [Sulfidibacter corallicola]
MMYLWVAILGGIAGHLVRRVTPIALKMKDTQPVFRFPWVEVSGALIFALVAHRLGVAPEQWKWYLFTTLLLAISVSDYATKLIPDIYTFSGTLVGIASTLLFPGDVITLLDHRMMLQSMGIPPQQTLLAGAVLGIGGAACGFVMMEVIRRTFRGLLQMEAMGLGDSLIMMMAGAFVGPQVVFLSLLPACLIGVFTGFVYKLLFSTPHAPFGPSLSMGVLSMVLFGEWIVDTMRNYNTLLYQLPPKALIALSLALIGVVIGLVLRMKKKAAEYERMIEEDYEKISEKLDP